LDKLYAVGDEYLDMGMATSEIQISDFMGYRELGGIGFEARMESFRRLERILKNMDYEYICLILLYELLLNEVHMTMHNILYELRVF